MSLGGDDFLVFVRESIVKNDAEGEIRRNRGLYLMAFVCRFTILSFCVFSLEGKTSCRMKE